METIYHVTYEIECNECEHRFEALFENDCITYTDCPECGTHITDENYTLISYEDF